MTEDEFRWVIAEDYYDGAISGIAKAKDTCVYFRMIAWDDERWLRVFACASVDCALIEGFREDLETVGPGTKPFWLPGREYATPKFEARWQQIRVAALNSTVWDLVSGHELLGRLQVFGQLDPQRRKAVADMVRHEQVKDISATPILESFLKSIAPSESS